MSIVTLPIIYDNNLLFYPNGKLIAIDTMSVATGYKSMPDSQVIHGATTALNYVNYLGIRTPQFGEVYAAMTIEQYNELIAAVIAGGGDTMTETYTIGTDQPVGLVIEDAALWNSTINAIFNGGIAVDIRTVTYSEDNASNPKTGILTFPEPLADESVVSVLYHKN